EPAADRLLPADRPCLFRQHQEGGLKRIFGIVLAVQNTPADAKHQRAMPLHDDGKCRLILAAGKPFEQLPIGRHALDGWTDQPANMMHEGCHGYLSHVLISRAACFLTKRCSVSGKLIRKFSKKVLELADTKKLLAAREQSRYAYLIGVPLFADFWPEIY